MPPSLPSSLPTPTEPRAKESAAGLLLLFPSPPPVHLRSKSMGGSGESGKEGKYPRGFLSRAGRRTGGRDGRKDAGRGGERKRRAFTLSFSLRGTHRVLESQGRAHSLPFTLLTAAAATDGASSSLGLRERHRALRALPSYGKRPLSTSRPSYPNRRCTVESGREGEKGGASRVTARRDSEEEEDSPLLRAREKRGTSGGGDLRSSQSLSFLPPFSALSSHAAAAAAPLPLFPRCRYALQHI